MPWPDLQDLSYDDSPAMLPAGPPPFAPAGRAPPPLPTGIPLSSPSAEDVQARSPSLKPAPAASEPEASPQGAPPPAAGTAHPSSLLGHLPTTDDLLNTYAKMQGIAPSYPNLQPPPSSPAVDPRLTAEALERLAEAHTMRAAFTPLATPLSVMHGGNRNAVQDNLMQADQIQATAPLMAAQAQAAQNEKMREFMNAQALGKYGAQREDLKDVLGMYGKQMGLIVPVAREAETERHNAVTEPLSAQKTANQKEEADARLKLAAENEALRAENSHRVPPPEIDRINKLNDLIREIGVAKKGFHDAAAQGISGPAAAARANTPGWGNSAINFLTGNPAGGSVENAVQSNADSVYGKIGQAIQGGVLRKFDLSLVKRSHLGFTDPLSTVDDVYDTASQRIAEQRDEALAGLEATGRDVSGLRALSESPTGGEVKPGTPQGADALKKIRAKHPGKTIIRSKDGAWGYLEPGEQLPPNFTVVQ